MYLDLNRNLTDTQIALREQTHQFAAEVLRRLIHIVATASPGAKLGSTAPYAYAHFVLVETGESQPRTLANAFLDPVKERPGLVRNAYSALAEHLGQLDEVHGRSVERRASVIGPRDALQSVIPQDELLPLADLARWTAAAVARLS